jgi:HAD superfamily hydrolase (TIGR01509 family)
MSSEEEKNGGIRIVCFDLGGVLIRLRKSWVDVCRAAGFEVRGDAASDRFEDARSQAMAPYVLGRISHDEWAEKTSRVMGGAYSPEELTRIHDAWLLEEYAGVAEVVDELHARGIATACLSNTNEAHWARLVRASEYPTIARLGARYASHLLGCGKPDEAMYRAFERAARVESAAVLFFDDLGVNVDAARAFGWNAERIDPTQETAPQMRGHLADYRVV